MRLAGSTQREGFEYQASDEILCDAVSSIIEIMSILNIASPSFFVGPSDHLAHAFLHAAHLPSPRSPERDGARRSRR